MAYTLYRQCNFGIAKTGLATVGYRLYLANGTASGARITAGVAERGATGIYGASVTFPDAFVGELRWDTGEGTPAYASEDVNPQTGEYLDVKVSVGSSGTTLVLNADITEIHT